VVLRRGDDERVRRRAQPGIVGVELQPGGAVAPGAEIADDLVLDAVEQEGGAAVARRVGAAVV